MSIHKLSPVILILICAFGTAFAEHQPLWELGVGIAALDAPYYRGSKAEKQYYIPIPFAYYRGLKFRSDDKGVYSKIFDSRRLNLDVSFAANVPVPKDIDGAREGMPRLDFVGEIGPELEIDLWKSSDLHHNLWFSIPLRGVFSIGGDPLFEHQGWVISPFLQYQTKLGTSRNWWRLRVSTGPIYGSSGYHDYFYEVKEKYANNDRTEYHPDAGYSGNRVTMSLAKYNKNYLIAFFARYDDLSDAEFADSPLVETKHYFVSGFMFTWIFQEANISAPHPR